MSDPRRRRGGVSGGRVTRLRRRRWVDTLRRQERVVAVSVSTALVMTGQGMAGPVLPVFARQFGVSLAAVGTTMAAFGLARLLLNMPLGSLSDRWGRRFLLVGGPMVLAVSMAGAGMAGGIVSLTLWRFLSGAGSAMYMTGALVYVTDISTPANRGRLIGFNQGALLFGQALGPGFGGIVADLFGIRAPFFVIAGAGAAASVYGYFRLPETRPELPDSDPPVRRHPAGRAWRRLVTSRAFLAAALVNFVAFVTRSSARNTLMPLAGVSAFGLSLGQMGMVLTGIALVNLVLLPPAASISDRYGPVRIITPSLLGTAGALMILAIAADPAWFLAGAGVLALATAVAGPAPSAFAADSVPDDMRGFSLGMFRTAGDLGLLVGPPALGWMADLGGYGFAFAINGALMAVAAAAFLLATRGLGRPR